jgi:subtilase family serine protease
VNGAFKFFAPLVAVLAVAACSAGGSSSVPVPGWQSNGLARAACDTAPPGGARCLVLVESKGGARPNVSGWGPSDIQTAYNLPSSTKGTGELVAIVDAYDNPDVTSDLGEYRSYFGLGTAKFHKYNQKGQQSNYPQGSPGWGVEIDLDAQMVSAACPKCTIDLIEANSENSSDLQTAEAEAVKLGAHIISNSWICYSYSCTIDPSYFDKKGVVYTAGSGDDGYGQIGPPMSLATVTAVGGTTLAKNSSGYSETVWPYAGAGCTSEIKKPKWQHDPSCSYRTAADVSAVADNVAEYDTFSGGGWFTVGGTSVATPLIAAVYALAGNASKVHADKQLWSKKASKGLHVITSGSDGSCGGSYLCTAGTGQYKTYAGPTGWGTPDGVSAF